MSRIAHRVLIVLALLAGTCLLPQRIYSQTAGTAPAGQTQVSPNLLKLLGDWAQASSQVRTLSGKHHRIVYDLLFEVEKHADGKFYYESPDKGRIDIEEVEIPEGAVGKRLNKENKPFELKSDQQQKWICDGERIIQIDERQKTADIFMIPPEGRGQNIMNGPLPFLFGMPPEKALQRYQLALLNETPTKAQIKAVPNWQQDAANWKEAFIILDKRNYLPSAVKLIDPTGNSETVYVFESLEPNKRENPFNVLLGRKWYAPSLDDYNITTKSSPPVNPGVPSLIGLHFKTATEILKAKGLEIKFLRGRPATDDKLVFRVYEQNPKPGSTFKSGDIVEVTLYDKVRQSSAAPPVQRQ